MERYWQMETQSFDDHHFSLEDQEVVGELAPVWAYIVLKCLYLARMGRLEMLWTVHSLARAVIKRTEARDKR